jgi:hypothetical protein
MTREEKLLQEIRALHKEIIADYKTSLDRCIKIGGILSKQKTSLPHGHFINWVKTYLPFSERTARHYMELEHHKDRLKKEKINSLQDAYKLISDCNIKKMVSQVSALRRPVDRQKR